MCCCLHFRLIMILRKYRNSDTSKIKFSDVRQTESQPTSSPSVYYEDVNADTTTGRIQDSSGQGRPAPSGGHDYLNVPRTTEFSQQESSTYDSLDTDATGERSPYETLNM